MFEALALEYWIACIGLNEVERETFLALLPGREGSVVDLADATRLV